ncbi:hypothetical protein KA478_00150 [Patescibacteria group bacterium]|nr:hypothetical protein [Patescibacteria group bacterium]
MFVFNSTTKELVLPLVLSEVKKTQSCNIIYDNDGKELRKDCYPYDQQMTTFAGIKAWSAAKDVLTEKISIDYKDMIKNPYPQDIMPMDAGATIANIAQPTFIDPRWFSSMQARVGYK